MINQNDAIVICSKVLAIEYETNCIKVVSVELDLENKRWLITFKVWDWFNCVWYVWEGDNNKAYCKFLKELSNK